MIKRVVYTCITGEYDNLVKQKYCNPNYEYVCFTDNADYLKSGKVAGWQCRPLVFNQLDNSLNNRWHKMHSHILFPQHEISIYIDANVNILSPWLFNMFEASSRDIMLQRHSLNASVLEEAELIKKVGKDIPANVDKMLAVIKAAQMPQDYGMTENNIICCRNTPQIKTIMEQWWLYVRDYCHRDQMSLTFVLWQNGMNLCDITINNLRSENPNVFCPSIHRPYISLANRLMGSACIGNLKKFYFMGFPWFVIKNKSDENTSKKYFYLAGLKVLNCKISEYRKVFYLFGFIPLFCKINREKI